MGIWLELQLDDLFFLLHIFRVPDIAFFVLLYFTWRLRGFLFSSENLLCKISSRGRICIDNFYDSFEDGGISISSQLIFGVIVREGDRGEWNLKDHQQLSLTHLGDFPRDLWYWILCLHAQDTEAEPEWSYWLCHCTIPAFHGTLSTPSSWAED